MRSTDENARRILETQAPLIRAIVATTSKRDRRTPPEEAKLFARTMAELSANQFARLRRFRGRSSLETYLTVVVQELAYEEERPRGTAPELEGAIEHIAFSLPPSEALVVKMWFERGMTASKIAAALRMPPGRVHALIASATDRVQRQLSLPEEE